MNILRITRSFFPIVGGQENHILNVAVRQQQQGIHTWVVTVKPEPYSSARELYRGVHIERVKAPFRYSVFTRLRLYYFIFTACIRAAQLKKQRISFNLIIAHDYWSGIAALAIKYFVFRGTRVIYFAHGVFQDVMGLGGKFFERWYFRFLKFDHLICVDDGTKGDVFFRKKVGIDATSFSFVHHGLDTEAFRPLHVPREELLRTVGITLPADSFIILSTAKINRQKGSFAILKAFAHFLQHNTGASAKKAYLMFANFAADGVNDEINRINHYIAQHNIRQVVFTGSLNHHRMPELLNIADVWISLATYSNLGNALLEAMATGRIVVTSNAGDTATAISDKKTGFLVPLDDTASVASLLAQLYRNHTQYWYLGKQAREFAVKNFSWERRLETEMAIYHKVLGVS